MAIFGLEDTFLDNAVSVLTIITVGGALVFGFGRWIKTQITNSFKNMIEAVETKVDTKMAEVKTDVNTKVGELKTQVDTSTKEVKSMVESKVSEVGMKMTKLEDVNTERFNAIKEGQLFVKDNIIETKDLAKRAVDKVEDVGDRLTEHIVESGESEKKAQRFRENVGQEEVKAQKFREGVTPNGVPIGDQYKTVVGGPLKKKKKRPDKPKGNKTKYNNPV